MSLTIKFLAFLLVLGLAGLFVLKKPDGQAWLQVDDLIPSKQDLTSTVQKVMPDQLPGGDENNVSVYRWQDAQGNWQFSDTPPSNQEVEQILISTNLNRDLAPPKLTARPADTEPSGGNAILIGEQTPKPGLGTTLDPESIKKLVDDANNVQELMDNRDQQMRDILGQ